MKEFRFAFIILSKVGVKYNICSSFCSKNEISLIEGFCNYPSSRSSLVMLGFIRILKYAYCGAESKSP